MITGIRKLAMTPDISWCLLYMYVAQYPRTLMSLVQYKSKKVPVPFPYNGGSTVLRLKKDCAKTLHEQYGCVFTDRFTTRLYDEAFSSTVYIMYVCPV